MTAHRSATRSKRELKDLYGVGPATLEDFEDLGVSSVDDLARRNPTTMYNRLCRLKGTTISICCLDVFRALVEQARNPDLTPEQRTWWYWTQVRKREMARPRHTPGTHASRGRTRQSR